MDTNVMLNTVYDEDDYYDCEDKPFIYDGSINGPLYTNHHSIPRPNDRTIRPDLEKLSLPDNIIGKADDIFQNMDIGTKRSKRRKRLVFFCTLTACDELGIPVEPNHLANICGIERCDISKSMSMCSSVHTNYDAPLIYHTPQKYISGYFKKLNEEGMSFKDGAMDHIFEMMDDVLDKDEDLYEDKPQTVAAAILVYYLQINNYIVDKSKYKAIFGMSDMTVNKIKNKVAKAYNE